MYNTHQDGSEPIKCNVLYTPDRTQHPAQHWYEKLTHIMMLDSCLHISLENTKLVRNARSIQEFFIRQPELLLLIMDRQAYFLSHVYPQNYVHLFCTNLKWRIGLDTVGVLSSNGSTIMVNPFVYVATNVAKCVISISGEKSVRSAISNVRNSDANLS